MGAGIFKLDLTLPAKMPSKKNMMAGSSRLCMKSVQGENPLMLGADAA
jgi:hypothetical protein